MASAPTAAPASATDDYGLSDGRWLEIDWREHLRTIDVDGATINYVEMGPEEATGEAPILFVHGLSGCWQNWLEQIPHFARRRRVVALDLPGFGASPMPPWEIEIPAYGRLVSDFCERLDLEPCALVGNSMGGFVGAETAICFPDRVTQLVLVSAAGISQREIRHRPLLAASKVLAAAGAAALESARASVTRPGTRQFSYGLIFRYPNRLRPELLYEQHVNGVNRPGFMPALSALLPYDFSERLPDIGVPTLIVWGDNDLIVPPRDADEFERLIPDSKRVIFPQTGHVPQMERPERFNRVLGDFLGAGLSPDLVATGPTEYRRPTGWTLVERALARRGA